MITGTMHIPRLETDRLILRAPAPQDFKPIAAFFASDRSRFVGGPKPAGGAWHFLTFMLGHWAMRGFGMWTITERGSDTGRGLVGMYYPVGWPERELGWHIWDTQTEGKGIATEASIAARRFAWDTLGWATLVSYISPDNTRSIALAKRLGAAPDPDADQPEGPPCQVWRHPNAGAA